MNKQKFIKLNSRIFGIIIIFIFIFMFLAIGIAGGFIFADRISSFNLRFSPLSSKEKNSSDLSLTLNRNEQLKPMQLSDEQPDSKRKIKKVRLFSLSDYVSDKSDYESIESVDLRFSPDGKHFALYPFYKHGKSILIVDGKQIGSYDALGGDEMEPLVKFSPDSSKIAYVALRGEKSFMIQDNKPGKQYQQAGFSRGDGGLVTPLFEFSPDSKHLAYVVYNGRPELVKDSNSHFVVFDGKEGKHYDDIVSGIVFSPDSKHFAYVANKGCKFEFIGYTSDRGNCYGGKSFVVRDNREELEKHDYIDILKFSPDSNQIVYAGKDGCPYAGGQGGEPCSKEDLKYFIVLQGKKKKIIYPPGRVLSLEISPKNELAYVYENSQKTETIVIWRGGKIKKVKKLPPSSYVSLMQFSQDGNRFGYFVFGDSNFVVINDQKKKLVYPPDSRVVRPIFSSDLSHFAYVGKMPNNEKQPIVILDGKPLESPDGMEYQRIMNLHFSEDSKSIFYNARSEDTWYYIEESVE